MQWWKRPDASTLIRAIRGKESQSAFSRRLSCTQAQLSRWETGKATPSPVFRLLLEEVARQRKVRL